MNFIKTVNRSAPTVILVIFAIYAVVIFLYAKKFNGNFSGFACIGDRFPAPGIVSAKTFVRPQSKGYDGQFFFFASHDPFIRKGAWKFMDVPAYRYQRIMYPWLAALFALGRPKVIPHSLVIVNVASILMGGFFVITMLKKQGMSPWYGLIYGFFSGFILCVLRDLSGPVAMGFMAGGLYFYSDRRFWLGALFLAGALLAREMLIIIILILLIYSAFIKKDRKELFCMSFSILPFLVWSGYVYLRLHDVPWRGGKGNFGLPFIGLLTYIQNLFRQPEGWSEKLYLVIFLAVTFLSLLLAFREVLRSRNEVSLSLIVFSLLPIFMTDRVWVEPWSFGRVTLPLAVFLLLNFIRSRDKLYLIPLSGHMVLSVVTLWWLGII